MSSSDESARPVVEAEKHDRTMAVQYMPPRKTVLIRIYYVTKNAVLEPNATLYWCIVQKTVVHIKSLLKRQLLSAVSYLYKVKTKCTLLNAVTVHCIVREAHYTRNRTFSYKLQ